VRGLVVLVNGDGEGFFTPLDGFLVCKETDAQTNFSAWAKFSYPRTRIVYDAGSEAGDVDLRPLGDEIEVGGDSCLIPCTPVNRGSPIGERSAAL